MAEISGARPRPIIVKKRIIGSHAKHGGSWKIAYADFATAMMSLFIVLWMMNSNAKVKDAVAGYFKDPAGKGRMNGTSTEGRDKTALPPGIPQVTSKETPPGAPEGVPNPLTPGLPEGDKQKQDMQKLKSDLENAIRSLPDFENLKNHILISLTDEGVRMELMETSKGLFFANGSSAPTREGKAVITAVSGMIGKLPNRVVIEGHTDSVPFVGDGEYSNWELSSERANASRILMLHGGLRPNQLFEIRGFADQQLRLPDKADDPSNRRISIIVLNLPGRNQPPKPVPAPEKKSRKWRFFF